MDDKSKISAGFLQALSHHGTVQTGYAVKILENLHKLYSEESEIVVTEDYVHELITEINDNISEFDQKLVFQNLDLFDAEFIVFISTHASDINKLQTTYTEAEVDFFKLILESITLAEDHMISNLAFLNLTANVKGKSLTQSRAEVLLQKWCNDGYLAELTSYILFGPRALAEFSNYLSTHFPDHLTTCTLCNTTVFGGIKCFDCSVELHKGCLMKYLKKITKCPACKDIWKTPIYGQPQ